MGFIIEPISYDDYIRHRFFGLVMYFFFKDMGMLLSAVRPSPTFFVRHTKPMVNFQGGARPMQLLLSP